MRPISQQKQNDLIALLNQGLSTRKIASQLRIGKSTVWKIRKQFVPELKLPAKGRPRSINPRQENQIIRSLASGRIDTAADAQRNLSNDHKTNVSVQTVRNMLKRKGLKSCVKIKKPLLKPQHKKQRMAFAKKYQDWTVEDWKRVIFSDETKVNRFGSDGRKWYWKRNSKSLQPNQFIPTVKHGGGSQMVWGCMTAKGVGYLVKIEGIMNSQLYCAILEEHLLNSLKWYDMNPQDVIFQHDNDPKHSARMTVNWLLDNNIEVLDWPAQSPDLNPIEQLWDHFKRRLSDYSSMPSSMAELWERMEDEWNKITKEKSIELIESMPRRIAAVIKAKGGPTKY